MQPSPFLLLPHRSLEILLASGPMYTNILTSTAVENRIIYNNFGFPLLTHTYHWAIGHHPETVPDDLAGSRAIWLLSSYINHSQPTPAPLKPPN